jgi:hypothetical protein
MQADRLIERVRWQITMTRVVLCALFRSTCGAKTLVMARMKDQVEEIGLSRFDSREVGPGSAAG